MRHVRSILYAVVLAPAVWVLCGVGFTGDLTGRARDTSGSIESFVGLLLLLLAATAYAILIFAPISPAGPLLGGLAFLGVSLWALAQPASYAARWPPELSKDGFDLSLPGYGLAVLLAVPMICTALSARRWARYEPPVLPVIGTFGRARGAAAVAVIPIAVSETAALTISAQTSARMPTPEPPTQVIGVLTTEQPTEVVPTEAVPAPDEGGEATRLLPTTTLAEPDGEPTIALRPAVSPHSDEALQAAADNRPTEDLHTAAERPTEDLHASADRSMDDLDLGRPTREFGPGEKTQVIARDPGGTTQVIRLSGAIYPPPGETTQSIRPSPGTLEPPSERTKEVELGTTKKPAATATTGTEPSTAAASIVEAERPDPGTEATTGLVPAPPPGEPGERTVEQHGETTALTPGEVITVERPVTVLDLERPPDEAEEETHALAIPVQRQPQDD